MIKVIIHLPSFLHVVLFTPSYLSLTSPGQQSITHAWIEPGPDWAWSYKFALLPSSLLPSSLLFKPWYLSLTNPGQQSLLTPWLSLVIKGYKFTLLWPPLEKRHFLSCYAIFDRQNNKEEKVEYHLPEYHLPVNVFETGNWKTGYHFTFLI